MNQCETDVRACGEANRRGGRRQAGKGNDFMRKERLAQLIETLDTTRKLISIDIYYCIYDTDGIVLYMYPEDGDKDGIRLGTKFVDPTGKLDEVLATEKHIHNFIPMDRFGFYMEGNLIPVYDNGELCGVISSAYVPMNQQQLAAREMAVQSIYSLIMSIDLKNNNHCTRLYFNYDRQQFPTDAQHFDDFCEKMLPFVHPEDAPQLRDFTDLLTMQERLGQEKALTVEGRLRAASGEYRWVELILTRSDEFESSAECNTAVFMVRDIHERKTKELDILDQLERNNQLLFEQSMTDELTKLYNRKGLVWFGGNLLEKVRKNGQSIYVMVADLNGLKYINDHFGHEEGDNAIRAIADMLREVAPDSAVVSRTGGDEFTVLAALEQGSPIPGELEQKLLHTMHTFNETSGLPYMVEVCYGWDLRPASDSANLDEYMHRADDRMYDMKSRTRLSGRLTGNARSELSRHLGSAKQPVFILSADPKVHAELSELLDSGYLLSHFNTIEDALQRMAACEEMTMVFIDQRLEGRPALQQFVRNLPEMKRRNVIPVLLMEREDANAIAEEFARGVQDILTAPYNTVLHQNRIRMMSQMGMTNRKLGQLLEQQMSKTAQ